MADTLPSGGSFLLDSLGRAFGDILRKDFERELEAEYEKYIMHDYSNWLRFGLRFLIQKKEGP